MKVLDTYVCTCMQIDDETMGCFYINYVYTLVNQNFALRKSQYCIFG